MGHYQIRLAGFPYFETSQHLGVSFFRAPPPPSKKKEKTTYKRWGCSFSFPFKTNNGPPQKKATHFGDRSLRGHLCPVGRQLHIPRAAPRGRAPRRKVRSDAAAGGFDPELRWKKSPEPADLDGKKGCISIDFGYCNHLQLILREGRVKGFFRPDASCGLWE